MSELRMPRLSDTMEEGTIAGWLVADGTEVSEGQEIVEIEGDKATMGVFSPASGVLKILVREGETVATGERIAWIGEVPAEVESEVANGSPDAVAADGPPSTKADAAPRVPVAKVSPVARRAAKRLGVDLGSIAGSGPGGRIVVADVERAAARAEAAVASPRPEPRAPVAAAAGVAPEAPPMPQPAEGAHETNLTRTQQLIARRMVDVKTTVPDFQVSREIDMENVYALRQMIRQVSGPDERVPSLNDFVVRGVALALAQHPRINGTFTPDAFVAHGEVNVGVAVAAPDALVVPVVRGADRLGVQEIAAETRRLAGLARDGALTPEQMAGGTFTVSSLGMFGVEEFTAIINAPQAAILAVGAVVRKPVAHDTEDRSVIRRRMTVTLSCDHRIIYGADAARFLSDLRKVLESPLMGGDAPSLVTVR